MADYMKIMMSVVFGVMCVIFFVIGITSLRQVKTLEAQAITEGSLEKEIHDWFMDSFAKQLRENFADEDDLSKEDLYFKRYEKMSAYIGEKYPDLNELFLDHMVEQLYAEIFE